MTPEPGSGATHAAIVLLAAGSGTRVGAERNKVLLPLDGLPVLAHSVRTALEVAGVRRVVVVVRPEDRDDVTAALAPLLDGHEVWLVDGGAERHDSEFAALRALQADIVSGDVEVVAIHDSARPLASAALFREVIDVAARHGGAVPAVPVADLSLVDGARADDDLVAVQTPQGFVGRELLSAYLAADRDGFVGTDTAACLERYTTVGIRIVPGERHNLKITFPEDLRLAEELLAAPTAGPGS